MAVSSPTFFSSVATWPSAWSRSRWPRRSFFAAASLAPCRQRSFCPPADPLPLVHLGQGLLFGRVHPCGVRSLRAYLFPFAETAEQIR